VKARVFVTLKPGVLDPAGKAVVHGLHDMGFAELRDVRIGKFFEVDLDDRADARERLAAMCEQLLANTVIENYRIETAG
jgi:phosphoribosylformylglycinamidine synthase